MLSNLNEVVESELRRQGISRRVAVELGHASGAGFLLANSDLIAVVPQVLSAIYCRSGDLREWPIPFSLPRYDVKQYWHRTVNKDPAVGWLRNLLADEYHSDKPSVESTAYRPGPAEIL